MSKDISRSESEAEPMATVQTAASAGIPPGCRVCCVGGPAVFAALDRGLMAAKPPA